MCNDKNTTHPIMRKFIRHPTDIPFEYIVTGHKDSSSRKLIDVSNGGLRFSLEHPLKPGDEVQIKITIVEPAFEAHGVVIWCYPSQGYYETGIEFKDEFQAFSARMVEQLCQIEHYRKEVQMNQGRKLSSEEAAEEWIEKSAADFPDFK